VQSKITIATRTSLLALAQAELVKSLLQAQWPGLVIELLKIKTSGDQILDKPLREVGGKGLFVKEIEEALLAKKADFAVHSMKDVPAHLPEELEIPVLLKRENPCDVLVSEKYDSLEALPSKAKVGTASLRRKIQLLKKRPDLEVLDLRGNVDTRLQKLQKGAYDAIILARAGLKRLKLLHFVKQNLPFICAPGQGAIGIECRKEDEENKKLIFPFQDKITFACVLAERIILKRLEGACELPLGAEARFENDKLHLRAFVANLSGAAYLEEEVAGDIILASDLGEKLSDLLLAQGAAEILRSISHST